MVSEIDETSAASEFEGVTGTGKYSWSSQEPEYCHTHKGFQIMALNGRWVWFEGAGVFGTADSLEQARDRIEAACRRAVTIIR